MFTKRAAPAWQVTLNTLAWCCIILSCKRPDGKREREVLSTSKLKPNDAGLAKTGANVGGACVTAIKAFDVPVDTVDYCCSDTTSSNSSLKLPRGQGGHGGEGGAYAHIWAHFRSQGHILFFMLWCLSHLGNNEVKEVMQSCGPCIRTSLLRKKTTPKVQDGATQQQQQFKRWQLDEFLIDVVHAVKTTEGCTAYLREAEGIEALREPPGALTMPWP